MIDNLVLGKTWFQEKLGCRKDSVHQKSYFRQVWIFFLNFVLSACERECCCAIHIFLPPRSSETLQWRYIHELRHNNDFIQIFHQFFSAKNPDLSEPFWFLGIFFWTRRPWSIISYFSFPRSDRTGVARNGIMNSSKTMDLIFFILLEME